MKMWGKDKGKRKKSEEVRWKIIRKESGIRS
jgi:hypothetical protein